MLVMNSTRNCSPTPTIARLERPIPGDDAHARVRHRPDSGVGDEIRRRVDLVPRLVAQRRQVELGREGVGLSRDAPAIERNPPAARIQERVRAQRNAVRIEVPRLHRVFEVQIARAGTGRVHRPTCRPGDVQHQVGRARHRHGLGEVEPHPDGLVLGIAGGGVRRGRQERDIERADWAGRVP